MKKILITGGSGFIASHIADQLTKNGHDVYILDKKYSKYINKKQKMIVGNIDNQKLLKNIFRKIEIVYHFAAVADLNEANLDPQRTIKNNIIGTLNVLNACVVNRVKKFIFASSIYARSEQGGFYSTSKLASEMLIERFSKKYKLDFAILRFGTVYGERANKFNTIKKYIDDAIKNRKIIRNSTGNEIRSYIHVDDISKICSYLIKKKHKNVYYNIFGPKKIFVKQLLKIIEKNVSNTKTIYALKDERKYNYKRDPFTYKIRNGKNFKLKKYISLDEGILNLIKSYDPQS